jgi:tetratricopeptide (TPR) repeat protein
MEEAVLECERGLEVNPNSTLLLGDLASFCAWLGRDRDAIAAAELALRLSPRDPANHWRHSALACASFVSGNYERCRAQAKKLALSVRRFPRSILFWAASAAALDDLEDAHLAVERCLTEYPDLSLRNVWPRYMPRYVHKRNQENLEAMLRKAGLPE